MLTFIISKIFKKARLASVRNSTIHPTSKIESGSSIIDSSFEKYSFCGYDCDINAATIGSYTSIASKVAIGGARHPIEWVSMSPVFYRGRDSIKTKFSRHPLPKTPFTTIGNDVWIGYSAILIAGINVGNGAVIGAGSVVTKDVPPYAIVAGNPARLIKYRFDQNIINTLENTKWWELDSENILQLAPYIKSPEHFLIKFLELKSHTTKLN